MLPAIGGEHNPGLRHGLKDVQIQTFVAHLSVEALPVLVLPGTAGVDGQRRYPVLRQLTADRQRDELWPAISPDELGSAVR
jgi:hypothetical protein